VVRVLAENGAPNALAGAVTGIGFIGGGLVFRQGHGNGEIVRGVTTAAAIFATAAIGAAAGEGQLLTASVATALVLVSLELQHVPALRFLDARRWRPHFTQDTAPTQAPHPRNPPTNPKLRRACEARGSTLNDHLIVDAPNGDGQGGGGRDRCDPRHRCPRSGAAGATKNESAFW